MRVDISFASGDVLTLKDVESFYYDSEIQSFVVKDATGIGYLPRENVRIIIKKGDFQCE